MKNNNLINENEEMLAEYDFSNGVRGKYSARLAEQSGYVKLDPVILKYFKSSEDINRVLLAIISSMKEQKLYDEYYK